jgi:7-cyano-7-deazaguanine reductase
MNQQYGDQEILKARQSFELWENSINGEYLIHLEHPEFSALCPRSGYPDSGKIVIDYISNQFVLELKAFKLFINSYRNERISHENVTNQIAQNFFEQVKPISCRIIGDFMRRGGVKTVITVQKGTQYNFAPYNHEIL